MIHIHDLGGCAPAPLAHYLKALGILRLVAENQEHGDPDTRGWWEGERFRLATRLTREALEVFFLQHYEPTPFVSPWNRGSGFYTQGDPGLTAVTASKADRFSQLRFGISEAYAPLSEIAGADQAVRAIKDETKITKEDKLLMREELDIPTDPKAKLTVEQKDRLQSREKELRAAKKAVRESSEYKMRLAEAERRFKRLKADLIPRLRLGWRGAHQEWLNAALVLDGEGKARWPSLLGTGGADGRLDFTNNFMQRLAEVYDLPSPEGTATPAAEQWIVGALWGTAISECQSGKAVGQYLPGMAGGANSINGPDGDSLLNPFDFILMMEGTPIFTANATRRLGTREQNRAAAPFTVSAQGAGYASAADADESARGEQWMPIWSLPMTLFEINHLFAEGRAQIGPKSAQEPLDLAHAIARFGTSRGITAFQRYGYIERQGQSNLAVPLGRFRVHEQAQADLPCLDDLEAWLHRLGSAARPAREEEKKRVPTRLRIKERNLADSVFALTQHPDEPYRWQEILLSLAEVEGIMANGSGYKAQPVPKLRPQWVQAADDRRTPEFRLALAFALQRGGFRGKKASWLNRIRRHWLPLSENNPSRFATSGTGSQTRLAAKPEVVLHGRSGIADAIALVERRLIETGQRGERRLPLVAAKKAAAHPADLAAWLAGEVDPDRTLALARALMALDRKEWAQHPLPPARKEAGNEDAYYPDDAWLVIRLALLPWSLPDGRVIGADPVIFRRLANGDATTAVELALRRLRAAGIRTAVRATALPPETARLWAAALTFPISKKTAKYFLRRLDPRIEDKTAQE